MSTNESRANIQIVDDNPQNLAVLSSLLAARGYEVRAAISGTLALKSAQKNPPDLILLDIRMPEMDGYQVCERLKADACTREVPVIFISAKDQVLDKVKAFSAGGVDYVTKPFQAQELLARVETHLALRNAQQQLAAQNVQLRRANDELTHEITERVRAEAALQRRNRKLALLNQAGRALSATFDLEQVLIEVLGAVRNLLDAYDSSVWLLEPSPLEFGKGQGDGHELVCRYLGNSRSESVLGWRLPLGQGIAGQAATSGQSILVTDTRQDARHFKGIDQHSGIEVRSLIAAPLWDQQTIVGVLEVVDTRPQHFDAHDRQVIESLAATASIAIQNARLYVQTQQDAETKATLLHEVNHRVSNNLTALISLLHFERDRSNVDQITYQAIMDDLISRVQSLAAVHRMLSAIEWSPLLLSELSEQVITLALQALPQDKRVSVEVSPSLVQITPRQAHSLALVFNELTTNSVKYAWAARQIGHIAVRIDCEDETDKGNMIFIEFRDDGVGYPKEVLRMERHSVGWQLIQASVCHEMQGGVTLHNDGGAVTVLRFLASGQDPWR